jgi:recombinational DNA repair protein RecR
MSFTEFPSRLLENAVNEFASLPGVGRKTAFRLVMNLLSEEILKRLKIRGEHYQASPRYSLLQDLQQHFRY